MQGEKGCIDDLETRAPARGRISAFIDGCGHEEQGEWSGFKTVRTLLMNMQMWRVPEAGR